MTMKTKSLRVIQDEARERVGGLSRTSKMPCPSFSFDAMDCNVGSRLAKLPGTVCSKCYARRGKYTVPSTKAATKRRMDKYVAARDAAAEDGGAALTDYFEGLVSAIGDMCAKRGVNHFRWFDSGDIPDRTFLTIIIRVAERLPHISFWLPTREYGIIAAHHKRTEALGQEAYPPNLCVRIAHMRIGEHFEGRWDGRLPTSMVVARGAQTPADVYACPAHEQGNKCGDCRACWSPAVECVGYPEH